MASHTINIPTSIAVTITLAVAAGSYTVGRYDRTDMIDSLEQEISAYEKSDVMKLPSLISNLDKTSNELKLSATEVAEFRSCELDLGAVTDEAQKYKGELQGLLWELSNERQEVERLQTQLSSYDLKSTVFTVEQGNSFELVPERIFVGLSTAYDASAYVSVNNTKASLDVGQFAPLVVDEQECRIYLTSSRIAREASFKFVCERKS